MRLSRLPSFVATLVVACIVLAPAATAQEQVELRGGVTDRVQQPLEGYRVAFRAVGLVDVIITPPTDVEGRYSVMVPIGRQYLAVAVFSPTGRRIALDGLAPIEADPGVADVDITVPIDARPAASAAGDPLDGSDRRFLAFVEDAAFVAGSRAEALVEFADLGAADALVATYVAAKRFRSLPDFEFGARLGFVGVDFAAPSGDRTGLTDLDVWAKYDFDRRLWSRAGLAVGALLTLPTGDEQTGQSADALRAELFGAARFDVGRFLVSAHAGVRFNDDGTIFGFDVDGETAVAVGAGISLPVADNLVFLGEISYEGERFVAGEPQAELLLGADWKPFREGSFRLAVAAGLEDGSPDSRAIVGYAFAF